MKPFIYMGYGVNKLIFGRTGTEEPLFLSASLGNFTYTFIDFTPVSVTADCFFLAF
jgi:hypothetical protein